MSVVIAHPKFRIVVLEKRSNGDRRFHADCVNEFEHLGLQYWADGNNFNEKYAAAKKELEGLLPRVFTVDETYSTEDINKRLDAILNDAKSFTTSAQNQVYDRMGVKRPDLGPNNPEMNGDADRLARVERAVHAKYLAYYGVGYSEHEDPERDVNLEHLRGGVIRDMKFAQDFYLNAIRREEIFWLLQAEVTKLRSDMEARLRVVDEEIAAVVKTSVDQAVSGLTATVEQLKNELAGLMAKVEELSVEEPES